MSNENTEVSAVAEIPTEITKVIPQEVTATVAPMGAESKGEISALSIMARFARFTGVILLSRMEYYHIGKDILRYGEKQKLATRDAIFEKLQFELTGYCKENNINTESMQLNRKAFDRCLDAAREVKEANKLDVYKEWSKAVTDTEAKAILAKARGERQKKKPVAKSAFDRAYRLINEEIYTQTSFESIVLLCLSSIQDVKIAKSILETAENTVKRLEAKK